MKIIIVGAGAIGLTLANLLSDTHEVTIIEKEEEIAKDIATKTQALVLQGDGSDISILKEAEIEKADVIVTTVDDKTNVMICQIAKQKKVVKIISLIREPKNEELFDTLQISHPVFMVGTIVSALQRIITKTGSENVIGQLGLGEMQVAKIKIPENSKLIGKPAELKPATLLAIHRGGKLITDVHEETFQKYDVCLLAVKTEDLHEVSNLFTVS